MCCRIGGIPRLLPTTTGRGTSWSMTGCTPTSTRTSQRWTNLLAVLNMRCSQLIENMIQLIMLPCKWIWIFSLIRDIFWLYISSFLQKCIIVYHILLKGLHQWQYDDISDLCAIRNTIFSILSCSSYTALPTKAVAGHGVCVLNLGRGPRVRVDHVLQVLLSSLIRHVYGSRM